MSHHILKTIKNTLKFWYLPLFIGLIFIGVGIYTFTSPLESYLALSVLFSISFLVSGILEIVFSISNRKEMDNWGWTLIFGLITLLMGFLLIIHPGISIATLPLYIGFLVLFRSISAISYAVDLKNYGVADWGNLMIIGVLGVLFSFILIWNPVFAGRTIVFWTGIALLSSGAFGIYLSLKLKKLKDFPNNLSKDLLEKIKGVNQEIETQINSK